jgi:hypothetical protein
MKAIRSIVEQEFEQTICRLMQLKDDEGKRIPFPQDEVVQTLLRFLETLSGIETIVEKIALSEKEH